MADDSSAHDDGDRPSSPDSQTSAGFNTDQLPPNYSDYDDDQASADPRIIGDDLEDNLNDDEEEEQGEDIFNENFMHDYRRMEQQDQYESLGLDDSVEDERNLDQIIADRRAAEIDIDASEARVSHRRMPEILGDEDNDDDGYRPSKRTRAEFRPSPTPGSTDDADGMASSPGRSQKGNSREDVHMTDQTDDDPYDDEDNDQGEFEMYRVQGTLREWVTRYEVRDFIAKKIKDFLFTYMNPKNEHRDFEYLPQINEMVSGKTSPPA